MLLDIRMDWETYNINPNDHQPINADSTDESSGALRISDGRVQAARERKETLDSEGTSVSAQRVNVSAVNNTKTQTLSICMTLLLGGFLRVRLLPVISACWHRLIFLWIKS